MTSTFLGFPYFGIVVEIVVEADELPRLASDGVQLGRHVTQIRVEHIEGDVGIGVGDHLTNGEENLSKAT